ncbi:hypothetical protein [Mucilaginibacter sp.]|uniref:hypothetical protein n=1 Tax=Mucilaginibacter sp. TaxID=1882438 RepID=UPI0035BC0133
MNGFVVIFGDAIKNFWDERLPAESVKKLMADVLLYANANSETFLSELQQIQFSTDLQPLPIVFEALSHDTDRWGSFYVEMLETILTRTKQSNKPQEIIDHLIEYVFIEKQQKPFVQQIAARLHKELFSDNLYTKSAAISMLPNYLKNPVVKDKGLIARNIQTKLVNPKWRIRYTAYISLKPHGLLPKGYKLPFVDALFRIIYGRPFTM